MISRLACSSGVSGPHCRPTRDRLHLPSQCHLHSLFSTKVFDAPFGTRCRLQSERRSRPDSIPDAPSTALPTSETATASEPGQGMTYDEATGYLYDAASGYYFDAKTSMYFDPGATKWIRWNHEQGCYRYVEADGSDGEVVEVCGAALPACCGHAATAPAAVAGNPRKQHVPVSQPTSPSQNATPRTGIAESPPPLVRSEPLAYGFLTVS